MSDLRLQNKAHAVCSKLCLRVAHLSTLVSDLRLQKKAHEVCSKLFLRVAQLCQIFAYRTRHTKCVVSYFFGFLIYVRSSLTDAAHAVCSKLFRMFTGFWVIEFDFFQSDPNINSDLISFNRAR